MSFYTRPLLQRDNIFTGDNDFQGSDTFTGKPLFQAYHFNGGSTNTNFVGDGSSKTIPMDTEIIDQDGNYNTSTYTFTAPVDGTYFFYITAYFDDVNTTDNETIQLFITAGGTNIRAAFFDASIAASSSQLININGSAMFNLDANDTAIPRCFANRASGSGNNIDLISSDGTSTLYTSWGAFLVG